MTTDCMRLTQESEHRVMTPENEHCEQIMMDSLVRRKSEKKSDEEEFCGEDQKEDQLKKPRRKDTPVLNCPPHIPGVRAFKVQTQLVHLEDEEKNMKD